MQQPGPSARESPDPEARRRRHYALWKQRDGRDFDTLVAALHDEDNYTREVAARALGWLGDPRAVEPLLAAILNDNRDVGGTAALALARLGTSAIAPLLRALPSAPEAALDNFLTTFRHLDDESIIAALAAALDDPDRRAMRRAAWALGRLYYTVRTIPPLIAALGSDDAETRRWGAWGLGRHPTPDAIGALLAALPREEGLVRREIVCALCKRRDPRAVAPLLSLLDHNEVSLRALVAQNLGRLGDERAVPGLIAACADRAPGVRRHAATALGVLRARSAVPTLIALLIDEQTGVRSAAATALGGIGDERPIGPLAAMVARRDESLIALRAAARSLRHLGPGAIKPLRGFLNDERWQVRSWATRGLGKLRDAEAVPALLALLGDTRPAVRCAAAIALGKLPNYRAPDVFIAALGDTDPGVRHAAAVALGRLRDRWAVGSLIRALDDSNDLTRYAVVGALGSLGDRAAVGPLLARFATLPQENAWERYRIVLIIVRLEATSAIAPLLQLLTCDDGTIPWKVADLLGHFGDNRTLPALAAVQQAATLPDGRETNLARAVKRTIAKIEARHNPS